MTGADGPRSANVVWQPGEITRDARWRALGGPGGTVWFTGLPSSGKSTVAAAVEAKLLGEGRPAYVLDGDNLRHGLNGNLGFSAEDRRENVRRTAEVAALMADAGVTALASLVSPFRADRAAAREVHEASGRDPRLHGRRAALRGARGPGPRGAVRRRAGGCRRARARRPADLAEPGPHDRVGEAD